MAESLAVSPMTIEPKPMKTGLGPALSHFTRSAGGLKACKREMSKGGGLKTPTTSTCSGQSLGLGTKEGDHMKEKGTRKRDASEPPFNTETGGSETVARQLLMNAELPSHIDCSTISYDLLLSSRYSLRHSRGGGGGGGRGASMSPFAEGSGDGTSTAVVGSGAFLGTCEGDNDLAVAGCSDAFCSLCLGGRMDAMDAQGVLGNLGGR
mmetsp:Transcript_17413/g.44579  ORF Transcript_17413/g.44579 Transcript_17413/m.44579 type:complete len:208 (-) Transcript_17413:737-1360(-)